jgi:integration host factor subunit beta
VQSIFFSILFFSKIRLAIKSDAMTRSELIATLSQRFPQLQTKDCEVAVKEILEAITSGLVSGYRIEVRGFGSFGLNYRAPRSGRNPRTGKAVAVPGKFAPHFKAGKELRECVATPSDKMKALD